MPSVTKGRNKTFPRLSVCSLRGLARPLFCFLSGSISRRFSYFVILFSPHVANPSILSCGEQVIRINLCSYFQKFFVCGQHIRIIFRRHFLWTVENCLKSLFSDIISASFSYSKLWISTQLSVRVMLLWSYLRDS